MSRLPASDLVHDALEPTTAPERFSKPFFDATPCVDPKREIFDFDVARLGPGASAAAARESRQ